MKKVFLFFLLFLSKFTFSQKYISNFSTVINQTVKMTFTFEISLKDSSVIIKNIDQKDSKTIVYKIIKIENNKYTLQDKGNIHYLEITDTLGKINETDYKFIFNFYLEATKRTLVKYYCNEVS